MGYADRLSADNPDTIEDLACRLWGEPTHKTRDELRYGTNGSKSVIPKDGKWYDHETKTGGHYRDLYKLVHGTYPENGADKSGFHIPAGMLRDLGSPVGFWDYPDDCGAVVGRVVRFEPPGRPPDATGKPAKEFRQFRPNGAGWTPGLQGRQLPLYRLPELLHAPAGSLVYLTEGEKHADALRGWGLIATTNAGGAGKFRADHARALQGHTVIVLGDNDTAGRKHVTETMAILRQAGVTAHPLTLPNLPPKGDVIDWIKAGGTKEELARLAAEALQLPPAGAARPDDEAVRKALLDRTSAVTLLHREFPPEEELLGSIVTRSTRVFIVGSTGTGKTMLGLGAAGGITSGQGFLRWRCARPARVLYIDGEMPLPLLQQRVRDLARRLGSEEVLANLHLVSWQDAVSLLPVRRTDEDPQKWAPLNTPEGQAFVLKVCELIRPDVVIFDNVQALIDGDMKDEVPWNQTMPLVNDLTGAGIGQIWIDHTGWTTNRQYGASRKAWPFDVVGVIEPLREPAQTQPGELAFSLSFDPPGGKARRRTPDNWDEFTPSIIRLRDDRWTVEDAPPPGEADQGGTAKKAKPVNVQPLIRTFHSALVDAIAAPPLSGERAKPGETTLGAWESECIRRGLIEPAAEKETPAQRDGRRAQFRKAQSKLIEAGWIGVDRPRVMNLRTGPKDPS